MMDTQIEYAVTSDRVRIATLTLGQGKPLLIAATPPWSHVQQEMRIAPVQAWLLAIARDARIVRFDCRGTGLSDRDTVDISVEAQVRDLESVADHYGLESFALWGSIGGSPAAIAYAARHPERVSCLLLWGAYTRGSTLLDKPGVGGLVALLHEDWEMHTDTFAHAAFGWPDSDTAERYAELMRAAITQDSMVRWVRETARVDVTAAARGIRSRTLVMTRRDSKFSGVDDARELASLIPGSRLLILEGSSPAPFLGDAAAVVTAIREFMASEEPPRIARPASAPLTARESQVLRLLASGQTGKEIASELGISVATTQRHIANIYAKIGARGRVDAAAYAFEQGIVPRSRS